MNFNVFLAFLVGFLAVNVSVQSPTLKEDSVKDLVVEVLNEVLNVSTRLLDGANGLVDSVEKNQDQIKDQIVAFAVNVGKNLNTLILQGIDELRDGATDDGKAVIDCIDAEQTKTEAAFTKVFGDIGTCAAGENPKVIAEIRVILQQLADLKDDIQGQSETLGACSGSDLTCLQALLTTLGVTANKIPDVVLGDVLDIVTLIETIIADVQGCAGEIVAEIKSDAQDIFNEAVVCIKK